MEEDILNYLPTVMFRGTPCTLWYCLGRKEWVYQEIREKSFRSDFLTLKAFLIVVSTWQKLSVIVLRFYVWGKHFSGLFCPRRRISVFEILLKQFEENTNKVWTQLNCSIFQMSLFSTLKIVSTFYDEKYWFLSGCIVFKWFYKIK